ncbi:MAG TPA: glutamate-5-semialdehyde dehydrogenase, partial [Acidimicrobiia bacterium]|nr:glutamate-5-semialdehyde dehydrogenase [Acidimicrobiia bacterium]
MAAELASLGVRARAAVKSISTASSAARDQALLVAADLLLAGAERLLEANRADVAKAEADGLAPGALDRLALDPARIDQMAEGLRQVASLPDVLGEVLEGRVRPNGLRVERVRVPLGVVGIIYENRPNVTSDAAALCVKSGNVAFLRGSSSALESNRAVVAVLREALSKTGLSEDGVLLVEDTSHATAVAFMRLRGVIDCLIPRGGRGLIDLLLEEATVPYVLDGDGNCHVYVDGAADLSMALDVALNAKTHRFGVCNAAETVLVDAAVADEFVPRLADAMAAAGVEIRGDAAVQALVPAAVAAEESDWATEYLGPTL